MKQLVESGANINARSRESKNHTALHEAVIGGHKDVAKYLLQMGANQVQLVIAVCRIVNCVRVMLLIVML